VKLGARDAIGAVPLLEFPLLGLWPVFLFEFAPLESAVKRSSDMLDPSTNGGRAITDFLATVIV
jgi:hypothetical protein